MPNCLYCNAEGKPICKKCLDYINSQDDESYSQIKLFENLLNRMKKDCDELEEAIKLLKG